jgi:hypothetical protein
MVPTVCVGFVIAFYSTMEGVRVAFASKVG